MSDLRILYCGGRSTSQIIATSVRACERLLIPVRHLPTRKPGTKSDPLDDIEGKLDEAIASFRPSMILWFMCKQDCPPGLISGLRSKYPDVRFVFHSFDDPLQIDLTGSPWALEFPYAVTCCQGSVAWYADRGIEAICLYPPADPVLHGEAKADPYEICDLSLAATNIYARERFPDVMVSRTELIRRAAKLGLLHLYGPWHEGNGNFGASRGVPELESCWRGKRNYEDMPGVFAATAININSHVVASSYQYLNERVITCMGSGGFLLVDRVNGLEELFKPGVHLDTYGDADEFEDRAKFWLKRPQLRRQVAARGKELVLLRYDSVAFIRRLLTHVGLALG
jgi:hypothetical protein